MPRLPEMEFYHGIVQFCSVLADSPRPEIAREAKRWLPLFEHHARQWACAAGFTLTNGHAQKSGSRAAKKR
jgi:hypothetical protein